MQHVDSIILRHLQRGVNALVARGPDTAAEALLEIARRVGGLPAIVAVLNEMAARPKPPTRRRTSR